MPRPNRGPRLAPRRPKGYSEAYWFIRWYERGKRRERGTGCRLAGGAEAKRAAEQTLAEFILGRATPIGRGDPARTLIAPILDAYGAQHGPTTADPDRIDYCIEALSPFFGVRFVADITETLCRDYAAERDATDGTIRRELGCLTTALKWAVRNRKLATAPAVWLPDRTPSRDRWLTRSEACALLRAARRQKKARWHLPLFILIGLYTGARSQAILTLRWTQNTTGGWVDLDGGRIDFNPIDRAQTSKRRAIIPIPPRLLRFLEAARERAASDWVIQYDGASVASIKRAFATACREAALADVTPHTLRHTCATWLSQNGVRPKDAAPFLGMTVETFERVYWHHHPDFMAAARDALGGQYTP